MWQGKIVRIASRDAESDKTADWLRRRGARRGQSLCVFAFLNDIRAKIEFLVPGVLFQREPDSSPA
jgi:hypothetical protein